MGRAVCCEMCKGTDVVLREIEWNQDIATFIPRIAVVTRLALICRRCLHLRLTTLKPTAFSISRLSRN